MASILDLKRDFADNATLLRDDDLKVFRSNYPPGVDDPETFLLYTRAMWRLAFVHRVYHRRFDLRILDARRTMLEEEVALWLALPGFKNLFESPFIQNSKVYRKDFKAFVNKVLENGATDEAAKQGDRESESMASRVPTGIDESHLGKRPAP
jgi:hypothetical protein